MSPDPRPALPGARDPAQPLLTLLDPAGRVELSGTTCANWAAKTANLLHGQGVTGPVGLLLPLHWQAVTLLLGAVAAGCEVRVVARAEDLGGCEVAFVTAADADAALLSCDGDVLAVSTAPLGGRLRDLPVLVLDAGQELPGQADQLAVPAARTWSVTGPHGPVTALPDLGLGPADRVLTVLPPADPVGLLSGLLAPLAAGAALVLAPGPVDAAAVAAEQVTACVGTDLPGARRLG